MKSVGIFTFHRALNYGAVWQCWALKTTCENLGYAVQTIDYNPWGHYTYIGCLRHHPIVAYRNTKMLYLFNRFVAKHLNPTPHSESHDYMVQNPPQFDVCIVGSDTVWAKDVVGDFIYPYLFDFLSPSSKRISYAASLGGGKMIDNQRIRNLMGNFSSISVREKQSVAQLLTMTDKPILDVCDPTMLISQEQYMTMEQSVFGLPHRYIVFFDLAGDSFSIECVKTIQKILNIPVINLVGNYLSWAKRNILAPSPEQFLYVMRNAEFICTNSFHGTVFATIFRRPFICVEVKQGGRAKSNGRVTNLLQQTGLLSQYITDIQDIPNRLHVDYPSIESDIQTYRQRSLSWLQSALSFNESNKK